MILFHTLSPSAILSIFPGQSSIFGILLQFSIHRKITPFITLDIEGQGILLSKLIPTHAFEDSQI
jgi:hypothetical protein